MIGRENVKWDPNQEYQKTTPTKKPKYHNDHYVYKTKECLELLEKLHHTQGREKLEELKERNYRAIFKKREHRCWNK